MAKILLVEDDNNLREIFEMRLQADGYQTVTAGNGEEGLTVAMKEKPDLIIADVMMPKLSGFDMLENLRAVPEMKTVKVIMMTALGQAEDRNRGESLGVVKYLVKSQATLEDFARTVREVLPPAGAAAPTGTQAQVSQNNQQERTTMQDDQTTQPTNDAAGSDTSAPADNQSTPPVIPPADGDTPQTTEQEQGVVNDQVNNFANPAPAEPSAAPAADQPGGEGMGMGSGDMGMPTEPAAGSTVAPSGTPASTEEPATTDGPAVPPATPPTPDTNPPATPPQTEAPTTPDNSGSL